TPPTPQLFSHPCDPSHLAPIPPLLLLLFFFFNDPPPTALYTLSLHDALPICSFPAAGGSAPASSPSAISPRRAAPASSTTRSARSEEHTSELQSLTNLVCRLLLEKKKRIEITPLSAARTVLKSKRNR